MPSTIVSLQRREYNNVANGKGFTLKPSHFEPNDKHTHQMSIDLAPQAMQRLHRNITKGKSVRIKPSEVEGGSIMSLLKHGQPRGDGFNIGSAFKKVGSTLK